MATGGCKPPLSLSLCKACMRSVSICCKTSTLKYGEKNKSRKCSTFSWPRKRVSRAISVAAIGLCKWWALDILTAARSASPIYLPTYTLPYVHSPRFLIKVHLRLMSLTSHSIRAGLAASPFRKAAMCESGGSSTADHGNGSFTAANGSRTLQFRRLRAGPQPTWLSAGP